MEKKLLVLIAFIIPTVKIQLNNEFKMISTSTEKNYVLSFDKPPLKTICDYSIYADIRSSLMQTIGCKAEFRAYDAENKNSSDNLYDFNFKYNEDSFSILSDVDTFAYKVLNPIILSNSSFVLI